MFVRNSERELLFLASRKAVGHQPAGRTLREIPVETIEDRVNTGTAMPSGFTNSLTRNELRDLIAYLASLKGSGIKP